MPEQGFLRSDHEQDEGILAGELDHEINDDSVDSHDDDDNDDDDSITMDTNSAVVSLNKHNHEDFVNQDEQKTQIQQLQQRARADTRRIRFWRGIVTATILVTATAVSLTTYFSLRAQETTNFETAYRQFARTVGDAALEQRRDLRRGLQTLGQAMTAGAMADSATWPAYRMPFYESYAANFLASSPAERLSFRPLVKRADVTAWIAFANATYQRAFQEGHMIKYGNLNRLNPMGYKPFISQQIPDKGFVPDDPDRDMYFPTFEASPPAMSYGIINYNIATEPDFDTGIRAALMLQNETTMSRIRPYMQAAKAVFTEAEHNAMHDPLPPGETEHPHSFFYHPVQRGIPNLEINNNDSSVASEIIGVLVGAAAWDQSMRNLLPSNVNGLLVVISNTCDDIFSYSIYGPKANFLGSYDAHDQAAFGHLHHFVDLALAEHPDFATTPGHCLYQMHIYPTKDFENAYYTDTPLMNAVLVAVTFVFIALAFVVFDVFNQRRNGKLVADAARSNALVTQLFPGALGEQIMGRSGGDENNKKNGDAGEHLTGRPGHASGKQVMGKNPDASDKRLAELYLEASVLYADITGFDAWCSTRSADQVFTLLETLFQHFDEIAKRRRIFKVETVGDTYVATSNLPEPRRGHALEMARFARDIMSRTHILVKKMEVSLGPDTTDLNLKIGIHAGPITAGVLRGDRARFQLFGDTIFTAQKLKATSAPGRIHVSRQFADLLQNMGKGSWLTQVEEGSFWLTMGARAKSTRNTSGHDTSESSAVVELPAVLDSKKERLVDWCCETLQGLLKQIACRRLAAGSTIVGRQPVIPPAFGSKFLEEVKEIIALPEYRESFACNEDPDSVNLSDDVVDELRLYVSCVANMYRDNAFHNFEHASHVLMSVNKLMVRIRDNETDSSSYGITSDPLTQFACAYSALIHDVDHVGVPNTQLVKEQAAVASLYGPRSVAEQNSLDISWKLLMEDQFANLRAAIYSTQEELTHFRELVVNVVLATDIMDKDLKTLRNIRWDKAFKGDSEEQPVNAGMRDATNRKATIVIEHLIQASDVSHTMQHWQVYVKWNERFFRECYKAYREGRADKDPSENWYRGEIGFFE